MEERIIVDLVVEDIFSVTAGNAQAQSGNVVVIVIIVANNVIARVHGHAGGANIRQPAGNNLPGFGMDHEAPFGE
jgi:hypothetical protein